MFLGLRTVIYHVADMEAARAWYTTVLGFGPYFDQPYYIGFNVGGYELGLHPGEGPTADKAESVVAYWGVQDAVATLKHLLAHDASVHAELQDVGEGIKVAAVKDPFGNTFGVIENPNFKL